MKSTQYYFFVILNVLTVIAPIFYLHGDETLIASDYLIEMKGRLAEGKLDQEQFNQLSNQLVKGLQQKNSNILLEDPSSIDLLANAGLLLINCPYFYEAGSTELSQKGIVAIGLLLQEINRCIDTSWSFPMPSANVSPPLGVPNAAAGMDPAAIKDHLLRKEYENAIKENNAINLKNKQQRRLRIEQEALIRSISGLIGKSKWNNDEIISHFAKSDQQFYLFNKFLK
jgi:hypothetical protein